MFLLIDVINPQGSTALTSRLDKIKVNVDRTAGLKASIEKQEQTQKEAFSIITVAGRWLVVYHGLFACVFAWPMYASAFIR